MLLVGSILLKKYILHITLFLQVVYARPLSQLTVWKEEPPIRLSIFAPWCLTQSLLPGWLLSPQPENESNLGTLSIPTKHN